MRTIRCPRQIGWATAVVIPTLALIATFASGTALPAGADPIVAMAKTTILAPSGQLRGVSCPSTSFCMAVGAGIEQDSALAEDWTGGPWTVTPAVSVGTQDSFLSSVSCLSSTWCMAVGTTYTSMSSYQPLIEQWDGTQWLVLDLTGTTISDSQLNSVSCPSTTVCQAVGNGDDQALTAAWDGTSWTDGLLGGVAYNTSSLGSVSCAGDSQCEATGTESACPPGLGCYSTLPVVATWDGASWTLPTVPNGNGVFVGPVGCTPATTDCAAVGSSNDDSTGTTVTVAETWDGTNWVGTPGPSIGPLSSSMSGMSCASPTTCLAVGDSFNVSPTVESAPVAETWDGSELSVDVPPNPSATYADLLAVSCPASTECTAVGESFDGSVPHTLIETWDAGTWEVVPSPDAGPVITTTTLPTATPGVPYGSFQLQVTGITPSTSPLVTAVRWSKGPAVAPVTALPKGMRLSTSGVLSGTPNRRLPSGPTTVSVQVTETVHSVVGSRTVTTKTTAQAEIPLTVG